MRMLLVASVAGLAVSASPAGACEAVNRTLEQTLELQRRLASTADSIYLARAVPVSGGYMSTYHRITVIDGLTPPRRLKDWPEDCGRADEGLTIVFAQRVRPTHKFDGWFWGGWALSAFYPSEIVDPEMAARMRRTADRLEAEERQ
ncbi:hypothetical protein CQ039_04010 [Brevundimonas sp. MYb52]|nr:hypothetical protein CQ039_04010 [Brevundimonas sp. MYb52]